MTAPMPSDEASANPKSSLLVLSLCVVLALLLLAPVLVFRYLPATDLPQHMAITSVLMHIDDPAWNYGSYFEIAWTRSLYVLPYFLVIGFAKLFKLSLAVRLGYFLSLLVIPLGAWRVLTARERPAWHLLLVLPVVYNRAFFWGFLNFNLALGMALLAVGIWIKKKHSRLDQWLLGLLCTAIVLTHVYGIAIVAGVVLLSVAIDRTRYQPHDFVALSPLLAGSLVWMWMGQDATGTDRWAWPGLLERVQQVPYQVLGGFQDPSELVVLTLWTVAILWLIAPSIPVTRQRWERLGHWDKVLWLFLIANVGLYFVLPKHISAARYIHFRHAVVAATFAPLLGTRSGSKRRLGATLGALAALLAVVAAWTHLAVFNAEAESFDEVLSAVKEPSRVGRLFANNEPHHGLNGSISRTTPYLHFHAYLQARHGGVAIPNFASFWNIPVRLRRGVLEQIPKERRAPNAVSSFYDYLVVRKSGQEPLRASQQFPFESVLVSPRWQLYRRIDPANQPDAPTN